MCSQGIASGETPLDEPPRNLTLTKLELDPSMNQLTFLAGLTRLWPPALSPCVFLLLSLTSYTQSHYLQVAIHSLETSP